MSSCNSRKNTWNSRSPQPWVKGRSTAPATPQCHLLVELRHGCAEETLTSRDVRRSWAVVHPFYPQLFRLRQEDCCEQIDYPGLNNKTLSHTTNKNYLRAIALLLF